MPISLSPSSYSRAEDETQHPELHRLREAFRKALKVQNGHLWEDICESVLVLTVVTVIWYLAEVVKYNALALLCHFAILAMLTVYIALLGADTSSTWDTFWNIVLVSIAIEFFIRLVAQICSSRFEFVFKHFFIAAFDRTTQPLRFIMTISSLYILSVVATHFSSANLLYTGFLCIETLQFLEKRQINEREAQTSETTTDQ